MPAGCLSYLHETAPKLLENQRAIVTATVAIAQNRQTMTYICQGTGTGKSTQMLEIGYELAMCALSPKSKKEVTVRLIVSTPE